MSGVERYGHFFIDDPAKFAMPGGGFKLGPVPPDDCISVTPVYSQATVDTLRAQLEAAGYEERRILDQRNGAREQVTKLHQTLEAMQARAEAAEAECARLRELLGQAAAVGITMLFDSHKADVRAEFSTGELMEVVAVSEPLNAQGARAEKVYRAAWDAARTKEETK